MENILPTINLIEDSIQVLNNTENEIEIELESFLKFKSAIILEYDIILLKYEKKCKKLIIIA